MSLKHLATSTVIYGLGGIFNRAVSLLMLPFLTPFLSKADFGVAGLLQILSFLVMPVFSFGIQGSMSASYFKETTTEGKKETSSSAAALMTASAFLLLCILIPSSNWMAANYLDNPELSMVVRLSVITTALTLLIQPLILNIQFQEKSRLFVALAAVSTLTTTLCTLAMVVWWRNGLNGWMAAQLVGQLVSLLLYGSIFLKENCVHPRLTIVADLLRMGLPMVPSFGFMYLIIQGNRYLVDHCLGVETLGIFSLASSMAASVSLVVSSFQTAWTPYFMGFRHDLEAARRVFGDVTAVYFLIMSLVAAGFFCFAQPAVELLTAQAFHGGWVVVGNVALAYILSGATNLLSPAQYFSGKLWHLTVMQGIAALFGIIISFWWIKACGINGAGFALTVSYLLLFLIHYFWNRSGLTMHMPVDYRWGKVSVVWAAVAGVALWSLYFPAESIRFGILRGTGLMVLISLVFWMVLGRAERTRIVTIVMRLRSR